MSNVGSEYQEVIIVYSSSSIFIAYLRNSVVMALKGNLRKNACCHGIQGFSLLYFSSHGLVVKLCHHIPSHDDLIALLNALYNHKINTVMP